MPEQVGNAYAEDVDPQLPGLGLKPVTNDLVRAVLGKLRADSATGPDLLPTRVLKLCCNELVEAVTCLTQRVLDDGVWPELWQEHWMVPLHKRKAVWDAGNYRGIHITPQLSKVVERVLKALLEPYLERVPAYGPHQFAYKKEHGARDALLFMMLSWIVALNAGKKVAVYCADVSGAFDKVEAERLVKKLRLQQAETVTRRDADLDPEGEVSSQARALDTCARVVSTR